MGPARAPERAESAVAQWAAASGASWERLTAVRSAPAMAGAMGSVRGAVTVRGRAAELDKVMVQAMACSEE